MKVITIDDQAYKTLVRKIDRVYDFVREQAEQSAAPAPPPGSEWLDNDQAAELLGVSRRTMQRLRSDGEITYSIRGGRVRYTLEEVLRLMPGRVFRSKHKEEADFILAHRQYRERMAGRGKKEDKRK